MKSNKDKFALAVLQKDKLIKKKILIIFKYQTKKMIIYTETLTAFKYFKCHILKQNICQLELRNAILMFGLYISYYYMRMRVGIYIKRIRIYFICFNLINKT